MQIYPLSLHDALPIFLVVPLIDDADHAMRSRGLSIGAGKPAADVFDPERLVGAGRLQRVLHLIRHAGAAVALRSEEHTSELQSLRHLVCRLLLEKKK